MFKIFEIQNNKKKEIHSKDGFYTTHELGMYQFEYESPQLKDDIFFIEDEYIHRKNIESKTNDKITTSPYRFFEDYFGFAKISINNEFFNINILGEKFELKEIEEIFLFLFEKNHIILNTFLSKSSISSESVYEGKEYLYSSKYLNLIKNFCENFEQLFINFKNIPDTVIRKRYKLSDYNSQTIDSKSIEWVLQNLDSVTFDNFYKNHPDSIDIEKNYGLIEKIGAEENNISFQTYENEVILGAFKFLQINIYDIKKTITNKLKWASQNETYENAQFIDFRDLKIIPFLRLLKDIEAFEDRVKKLLISYSTLFNDANPRNEFPKLTSVFYKYRHYQKAFNLIRLLRTSKYNIEGEIQLLNVRKLSELYELYNLYILLEILDSFFNNRLYIKEVLISQNDGKLLKVSYQSLQETTTITLYYEPNINNNTKELNLITIGNMQLNDKHCKPDFVIEFKKDKISKYCILDSKYSKLYTVKTNHLNSCLKKYIIDIGIKNEPYQKPDYLVLLHPDSEDDEPVLIYNEYFFPQIRTIVSKPKYTKSIIELIRNFVE